MDRPPQPETRPDWDKCRAGEIAAVQSDLRDKARRRTTLRNVGLGGTLLLVLVGVGLSYPGLQPWAQKDCLDCPATLSHLPQYHANTLPPETTLLVDRHLAKCPGCQRKYDQWLTNISWLTGR